MAAKSDHLLSVVVPLYNEAAGVETFHRSLVAVLTALPIPYEVIYCDDGSSDNTAEQVQALSSANPRTKLVKLSRNFGKESALTAGIATASGDAILMIDGDGQHPVELIPEFIQAWHNGGQVIIGLRRANQGEGLAKRFGSRLFYALFNTMTDQKLVPNSTDFRLIDRSVRDALLELHETNRVTRGLIDWLGFERRYIVFTAKPRMEGQAGYSLGRLITLATNSFVSLTPRPLYLFGYLGAMITVVSFITGAAVIIEQLLLGDPLKWHFTGTAMLAILILFLVGLLLVAQGIVSLYISHILSQSLRRPLYVIDRQHSVGLAKERP